MPRCKPRISSGKNAVSGSLRVMGCPDSSAFHKVEVAKKLTQYRPTKLSMMVEMIGLIL